MLHYENLWACINLKSGLDDEFEDGEDSEMQEYKVKQDGRIIQCWICSTENQVFSVHYGHSGSDVKLNWKLYVDGVEVSQLVTTIKSNAIKRNVMGITNAPGLVLPFKFSKTSYSNDEPSSSQSSLENLGIIELRVFRVTADRISEIKHTRINDISAEKLTSITPSEEKKYLAPHRVDLADKKPVWSRSTYKCRSYPLDPLDPGPYVIFRFQYRPLAFLQAQGVINSPKCVYGQEDIIYIIDSDEESHTESRQLEMQISEAKKRLEQLENRRNRRFKPYVKSERNSGKYKIRGSIKRFSSIIDDLEVIDLTED